MGKGEDLLEAVRQQDVSTIQKILNKGKGKLLGSKKINVNYQSHDGTTALHQAALVGNSDILCVLLDSHASANLQDRKGNTPLHYCAWQGRSEQVATLLHCGASHSMSSNNGFTPLHLSAQYGHLTTCKILLQYGADPLKHDINQRSCLDLSCEFGRLEVVELLLNCQFGTKLIEPYLNYNHEKEMSQTTSPLHLAARNGHSNVIRALLQAGMNINWRCPSGSCLHEAVTHGKLGVVQLLVDCGIDTSITNANVQTSLDIAKHLPQNYPNVDIIKILGARNTFFLQVYAINDFKNVYDKSSLAFTRGTIITVLEQNSSGNWKGRIDNISGVSSTGYFPSAYVRPVDQDDYHASIAGSDDSGIHPYDEDVNLLIQPSMYSFPTKFPSGQGPMTDVSYKYVTKESRVSPSISHSRNQVIPNVNNPSYDDVIFSQQVPRLAISSGPRPITTSFLSDAMSVSKPFIANPGYEDVIIDSSSVLPPNNGSMAVTQEHKVAQSLALPLSHNSGPPQMTEKLPAMQPSMKQVVSSNEEVIHWIQSINMQQYENNFISHGYDMTTISQMNPSDLSALKIFNSEDRKLLSGQIQNLRSSAMYEPLLDRKLPTTLEDWLTSIGLLEYLPNFFQIEILDIEKLLQTSWEDLQELKIFKLGHKKKIAVSLQQLLQICNSVNSQENFVVNQQTSILSQPTKPPSVKQTTVNSKMSYMNTCHGLPLPSTEKPDVKPKPKKVSSVNESPGLSSELQKALNRRQKVIHDAENDNTKQDNEGKYEDVKPEDVKPEPVVTNYVPCLESKPYVVNVVQPPSSAISYHQAKLTSPHPHHRGPPPNPPKRTTSVSREEDLPKNNKTNISSHSDRLNEGKKPSVAPKPQKPRKPHIAAIKPSVIKKPVKPTHPVNSDICTNRQTFLSPDNGTQKSSASNLSPEVGKRFDLSVLNAISHSNTSDNDSNTSTTEETFQPLISKHLSKSTSDDFQWPAPPPPLLTDDRDTASHSGELSSRHETCFEEDVNTGTVKRRPTSNVPNHQQNFETSNTDQKNVNSSHEPKSLKKNYKAEQKAPELPPKRSSLSRNTDPPPVPTKLGNNSQSALTDQVDLDQQQSDTARKVLDDIGSMFDDLVSEFDEILG